MDNIKDDGYYVEKIRGDLRVIVQRMSEVSNEEFCENSMLQDSLMFRLIQVSENSKRLSEEYKESRATVPWTAIYGVRNRIVHDYGNVDLNVVFETLRKDIPNLLAALDEGEEE